MSDKKNNNDRLQYKQREIPAVQVGMCRYPMRTASFLLQLGLRVEPSPNCQPPGTHYLLADVALLVTTTAVRACKEYR